MEDLLAQSVVRRVEKLKSERSTLEAHWEEIAERVWPSMSGTMMTTTANQTKGDKRTEKIFDSTAPLALGRFAAAMESMLTPRNSVWHHLRVSDDYLARNHRVALYLEDVNRLLFRHRYAPKANFASQQHSNYSVLGAFGTAPLYIDELDGGGLRYRACHLGNVFFLENHQGLIDSVFRKFPMTARQAVQKWAVGPKGDTFFMGAGDAKNAKQKYGDEKLPKRIFDAMQKNPEEEFEFIHAVVPRADIDRSKADYRRMPYASYYVAVDDKVLLSEGGYQTFPYAISRYVVAPGEVYGRSPAMEALPAIKTLNEQKKTVLKQGHKAVDPVLLAHDDGVIDTFSLRAGHINYGGVNADGRALVHALPVGNLAAGVDLMQEERAVINDIFLVTLFQILVETPQMTATEVIERSREKGALLSPTMGRQQSESLGPLIERELDLLAQQRLLPEMPPELLEAQGEYTIEYDSPLSRAQRAEEASGFIRTLEIVGNYAQLAQDPSPLDHFDWDVITPDLSSINAVPARWRRSMDAVKKLREDRAQQREIQQAIDAGPALASMMKAGQ